MCTPFEDFPSPTAVPPHDGFAALLPFTPSRLTPRRPGTGFTDMATSTTACAEVFVTGRSDALTADAHAFGRRPKPTRPAGCTVATSLAHPEVIAVRFLLARRVCRRREPALPLTAFHRCRATPLPGRVSPPGEQMARVDMVLRQTPPMRQAHQLELATTPRPRRAALLLVVPAMRPQDFPSGRSLDRLGCSLGSVVLRLPPLSRWRASRRLLFDPNRSSNR